ncbi:MAG: hypothetical protein JSW53_02600 [Candidatus Bathyarchaeota archaeon]|nr:MAG: hypothetical protein JSW53_02600 [Candidatus Bathyarchaeota archaeon]
MRCVAVAIVCGLLLSLATGIVENPPDASLIGYRFYGYPLVWRVTKTLQPTELKFANLAVDIVFWIIASLLALIILELLRSKAGFRYEMLLLPLALLIPAAFIMGLIHELGHAVWGAAVGGRLTYMQIAFFELYPRPSIVPQFRLGYAVVEGLSTEFASGLMSLGGSMTTNIASWLIALVLRKASLDHRMETVLKISGLLGLLDLPLYVIFPQIGLRHWVILGGDQPEPLTGARNMGVPDAAFYTITALTTLGLTLLYFKPFWKKVERRIRRLLGPSNS